jgi:hypothetical protein
LGAVFDKGSNVVIACSKLRPSGPFSGPPTFTQTAVGGNGLGARGAWYAHAAIGDEIAAADQSRPRRFA